MSETVIRPPKDRPLTPLWIIALFLSLSEIVLVVGVIQTEGAIQITLTLFVMAFPLLVAAGFFAILWNRPYVFYSPSEFGELDVQHYVEAMQRKPLDESKLLSDIRGTIHSTLGSDQVVDRLAVTVSQSASERIEEEIAEIMTSLADQTVETIRQETFVTVDVRPLVGATGPVWQMPYARFASVSEFLDELYFMLNETYDIPSTKYGQLWTLQEAETGRLLKDMGRLWAQSQGDWLDSRSLRDVGIVPGMKLNAIPLAGLRIRPKIELD